MLLKIKPNARFRSKLDIDSAAWILTWIAIDFKHFDSFIYVFEKTAVREPNLVPKKIGFDGNVVHLRNVVCILSYLTEFVRWIRVFRRSIVCSVVWL